MVDDQFGHHLFGGGDRAADGIGTDRVAEQIALSTIDAGAHCHGQFINSFNTFSDNIKPDIAAEKGGGTEHAGGGLVGAGAGNQRATDLEVIERQPAQAVKRREAGAEIIHGDAHAHGAQLVKGFHAGSHVGHEGGFGYFYNQPRRWQPGR